MQGIHLRALRIMLYQYYNAKPSVEAKDDFTHGPNLNRNQNDPRMSKHQTSTFNVSGHTQTIVIFCYQNMWGVSTPLTIVTTSQVSNYMWLAGCI